MKEILNGGVTVEFAYENERLSITLSSEKSGCATFCLSEQGTDRLKALLFVLDESLQKAKERQAKKSLNRSLWDEAKKKSGACSWKAKEIYAKLKAERKEMEQELACTGTREPDDNY
jgi:hypothetical protein